jgi:hypothetical protein
VPFVNKARGANKKRSARGIKLVIASAAKQSRAACEDREAVLDCFVASLLAMTEVYTTTDEEAAGSLHHGKWPQRHALHGRYVEFAAEGLATPERRSRRLHQTVQLQNAGLVRAASTMPDAIVREKQIKGGSRKRKLGLIEGLNPTWRDLYEELI